MLSFKRLVLASVFLVNVVLSFKIFGFDLNKLRLPPKKPSYRPPPPQQSAYQPQQPAYQEQPPALQYNPEDNWWQTQQQRYQSNTPNYYDYQDPQSYAPQPYVDPTTTTTTARPTSRYDPPRYEVYDIQVSTSFGKNRPSYSQPREIQADYDYQEVEIITAPTVRSKASAYGGQSSFEVKVGAGFHTKNKR